MKDQVINTTVSKVRIGIFKSISFVSIMILGILLGFGVLRESWLDKINFFTVGGLILAVSTICLCVILTLYGRTKLHRIWFLFNFILGLWGVGAFYIGFLDDRSLTLMLWRIVFVAIIFIPILNYHVVYILCDLKEKLMLYIF